MLYNIAAFGIPNHKYPQGKKFLRYSNHAENEALNDRYGSFDLPIVLDCDNANLIEVEFEVEEKEPVKFIYRISLTNEFDLCLVVKNNNAGFFVKTVWLNEKTDSHKTLNKSKYNRV